LAFAGRCGWHNTGLTINPDPNLNPFRPPCPPRLCGESPSRFAVHRSPFAVHGRRFRSLGFEVRSYEF
jgi:hypothetical protein